MSDKRKIHVYMMGSQPSVKGGMSSVVKQLLQHDWGKDMDIRYLSTHISGSVLKRCCVFAKSYLYLLLLLIFRGREIDVLYLHMSYKGSFSRKYLIYKLADAFGKKVILHLHGSEFRQYYEGSEPARKQRIRELFEGSERVIVLGEYWCEFIHSIAPETSVEVIQNAVPIPEDEVIWNHQAVQLLYMGVLIPRKGVKYLIDAMGILDGRGLIGLRNIKLVIGGTGDEMDLLKEQCRELQLEHCIDFAGWVDGEAKEKLLRSSQCLILPSYNEGLPVAILEALSYGVPVVSTDVGSIREAVIEGSTGHLVQKHAPEEIADAVADIISNEEIWSEYSRQARKTAEQTFNENVFFEKIETIIRSAVNGGREK